MRYPLYLLARNVTFLLDDHDRFSFRPFNRLEISIAGDRVQIVTLAAP
jgi:hypothetical protein